MVAIFKIEEEVIETIRRSRKEFVENILLALLKNKE